MRLVFHFLVEWDEDGDASRSVSDFQGFLQIPFLLNVSAGVEDSAQRVLQTFLVIGFLVNFDVGEQAEKRAAPIGASPGVSVVEAFVAWAGQAFGHVAHDFEPHLIYIHVMGADTGEGFDVNGDAFFDPVMAVVNIGKSEMDHFVGEHPIVREIGPSGVGADVNRNVAAVIAPGAAAANAGAAGGNDAERSVRDGKSSVVSGDGFGGPLHPFHHVFLGGMELAFFGGDVDARISDEHGGSHGVRGVSAGGDKNSEQAQPGRRTQDAAKAKTSLFFIHRNPAENLNELNYDA